MGAGSEFVVGRYRTLLKTAYSKAKLEPVDMCMSRKAPGSPTLFINGKNGTPIQSAGLGFRRESQWKYIDVLELRDNGGFASLVVGGLHSTALHASVCCWVYKYITT